MTPEEELGRAQACKDILENKYVKEALQAIEDTMVENIVMCPIERVALQTEMVNVLRAKRKFVEILQSHIQSGALAQFSIEQQTRQAEYITTLRKRKGALDG